METAQALRAQAMSERVGTSAAAIAEMIREDQFVLSESELTDLECRDEVLGGWVFAYRVCQLTGEVRDGMLRDGLLSGNPKVREQACDIVGDRKLSHMKESLKALFSDVEPFVVEAAKYNYAMLAV